MPNRRDDNVENLAGVEFFPLEEWKVGNFHPESDGKGRPTQVHIMFFIEGHKALVAAGERPLPRFVVRLKSARAVDALISALTVHRQEVFGPYSQDGGKTDGRKG